MIAQMMMTKDRGNGGESIYIIGNNLGYLVEQTMMSSIYTHNTYQVNLLPAIRSLLL